MIKGNHDNYPDQFYRDAGCKFVSKYPVILKKKFILSHTPLFVDINETNYINFYGHVHGSPLFKTKTENSQCVCVERQNFYPINIEVFNNFISIKDQNFNESQIYE
jgi:hypothetical protein